MKLDSLKIKKGKFDDVIRYELDDENSIFMLPEHVDDLKTKCEFRNVLKYRFKSLKLIGSRLGLRSPHSLARGS
jgi:hypothetical protein